jgi:hypothetical protein
MEKRQPLQQMLLGKLVSTGRRLRADSCPSPCTKINSKWIKDLNIRLETLKPLQEVVGNTLEHIGIENYFLSTIQKAQHLREKISKWDCIKLQNFCTAKETVIRLKRQPIEWEKIFASYSSDKGLIIQNLQGTQKIQLPKTQYPNEEMGMS